MIGIVNSPRCPWLMGVVGSYGAGNGTTLRETDGDLLKMTSVLLPRKDNYYTVKPC